MATTKVVSGNVIKDNTGSILNAGNVPSTATTTAVTIRNVIVDQERQNKVFEAVSPSTSGNLGTLQVIDGREFAHFEKGSYIGMIIGTKIAGSGDTSMQGGFSEQIKRPIARTESDRRINITSWNAVTGAATYGGNRGASVSFGTDDAARPTRAVPGELAFLVGGTPSQLNYAAR